MGHPKPTLRKTYLTDRVWATRPNSCVTQFSLFLPLVLAVLLKFSSLVILATAIEARERQVLHFQSFNKARDGELSAPNSHGGAYDSDQTALPYDRGFGVAGSGVDAGCHDSAGPLRSCDAAREHGYSRDSGSGSVQRPEQTGGPL